jgi:16S rRNA (cytosine967-C5)-methyltransferase
VEKNSQGVPEFTAVSLLVNSRFKPEKSRLVAYSLLSQVNREGAYANLRLPTLLNESSLDERDRAFVTELSYGTLRMQGKYDALIALHSSREFSRIEPEIVDVLRLGLHQLLGMRVPEHAAVSQTVELAKYVAGESTGTFVNAILRSVLRGDQLLTFSTESSRLAFEHAHPEWIVKSFYDLTQEWQRVEEILLADNLPAAPHLVAWPGSSTKSELLENGGEELDGVPYGVIASKPPHSYPAIRERRAGVQDRGSQIVSEIFLATASAKSSTPLHWLDMCAGPGGKAAYLYHTLKETRPHDTFTANEISAHRAELVSQVVPGELVRVGSGQELVNESMVFDRIVIDAPCSGLGALRRRPESRWRRTLADLKELVVIQRELLDAGVQILAEDGLIAYVTCSPHISETKLQVADFLYRHKDFELVSAQDFLGLAPEDALQSDGTVQLWPDIHRTDAMFMALFRRRQQGS